MPPLLRMAWRDLLFAHWPIPPDRLQALLPAGLVPDTFAGRAWVGVVPFRMTGVRPLGLPLPGDAFAFPEVNVRTYVRLADGTPAVWFLSLDGDHRIGAVAARAVFGVPYHHARIEIRREGDGWRYHSRRAGSAPAELIVRYRATGPASVAGPGTLEAFVSDRPALVATRFGRLWRTDVEHPPWRLRPAEATFELDTLTTAAGLALPGTPPVTHLADDLVARAHVPRLTPRPDPLDTGDEGE